MPTQVASLFGVIDLQDKLTPGLKTARGNMDSFGDQMSNMFGNLGKIALGATAAIGAAIAGIGIASINSAAQSETTMAQLRAVLKSTGGAAGITEQELTQMATALQGTTRFSDEQIIAAESMLLTFTQIGKKTMPTATAAVLDMATAMGMSNKEAAVMVGKALQDEQGVTALTRAGVRLTDQQQQQIKYFFRTGQAAKAQEIILKELATEFGGSAAAAGGTFAGRLDQLKNAFDDILETIGGLFLPGLTAVTKAFGDLARGAGAGISGFIEAVKAGLAGGNLGEIFGNMAKGVGTAAFNVMRALGMSPQDAMNAAIKIKDFFTLIGTSIGNAMNDLFTVKQGEHGREVAPPFLDRLKKAFGDLAPIFEPAVTALKGIADTAQRLAQIGEILFFKTLDDAKTTLQQLAQIARIAILDQLSTIDPVAFGNIAVGLLAIAGVLTAFKIAEGIQAIATAIASIGAIGAITLAPLTLILLAIAGTVLAVSTNFMGLGDTVANIGKLINGDIETVKQGFFLLLGPIKEASDAAQNIMTQIGYIINAVKQPSSNPWLIALQETFQKIADLVTSIVNGIAYISGNAPELTKEVKKQGNSTPAPRDSGGVINAGQAYRSNVAEVFFPPGSMATPLADLGGGSGGGSISIANINLYGVNDPAAMFDALEKEAQRRNRRLSWKAGE